MLMVLTLEINPQYGGNSHSTENHTIADYVGQTALLVFYDFATKLIQNSTNIKIFYSPSQQNV